MKKSVLFVFLVLALATMACSGLTISLGDNDGRDNGVRIESSGEMQSETREIGSFSRISFESMGELNITQGDQISLTVEADENIMPRIITEVRNDTLFIEMERGISLDIDQPITFTLVVTDLNELALNGLGSVNLPELQTEELVLEMNGAGGIEIGNLTAGRLEAMLDGLGSVELNGEVDELTVSIPGSGNFDGENLRSRTANVTISGLGSANVWVVDNLQVEISGAGSVDYYGSPSVQEEVNGLGRVNSRGDK
ncbi:MAG TPA: head GIN domain-containing protein [Anaerolineaceae bacterium]|nr:head GIN domain-containing protein [Anaerolineaceae bacterium]